MSNLYHKHKLNNHKLNSETRHKSNNHKLNSETSKTSHDIHIIMNTRIHTLSRKALRATRHLSNLNLMRQPACASIVFWKCVNMSGVQ